MDIIPDATPAYFDNLPIRGAVVNGADQVVWQKSPTLNWGNIYGDRRSSQELIDGYDPEEAWFQLMPPLVIEDETPIVDDTGPEEPAPETPGEEGTPTWEVEPSEPKLDSGGNVIPLQSQTEAP